MWEVNIHFLLIYSLSGPKNLPEYFQNVAAFILKSGSSQFFDSHFSHAFLYSPLQFIIIQYSPSYEAGVRVGNAM